MHKGLEEEWALMTAAIAASGIPVYPSLVRDETVAAIWLSDTGFSPFLDLAKSLGVRLLYARVSEFSDDGIDELVGLVTDNDEAKRTAALGAASFMISLDEVLALPDVAAMLEEAKVFIGRIASVEVQWVVEGIVHRYWRLADWYSSFLDRSTELATVIDADRLERANRLAESQGDSAGELARDPDFGKVRTFGLQRRVASKHFPALIPEEIDRLIFAAREIYEGDILPEQERALARRAHDLMQSGISLTKTANTLDMTRDHLQRLLSRHSEELS